MDNFTPAQYDRFEAYRRHALPKQAVRKVHISQPAGAEPPHLTDTMTKVIQQTLGQQVSQPVAQIVAGFSKVFVGEIIEKGECAMYYRNPFDELCACSASRARTTR